MTPPSGSSRHTLQREIGQRRPFRSPAQEAFLAIARTASILQRTGVPILDPEALSGAQYNVLRILRGAGADGLPTLAIRDRMIDPAAAITRLVDRLEARGLVARERVAADRRQIICRITPTGLELLDRLQPAIDANDERLAGILTPDEIDALLGMLERVREGLG